MLDKLNSMLILNQSTNYYKVLNTTHVTAVVDEPGQVAALGRVDDGVLVDSEQVAAADAFLLVASLAHIRYQLMRALKPQQLQHKATLFYTRRSFKEVITKEETC